MTSNGAAITAIRERSGLTKTQLARQTGIDPSHLNKIERGQRNGTPDQLAQIATVLKVPVSAILSEVTS